MAVPISAIAATSASLNSVAGLQRQFSAVVSTTCMASVGDKRTSESEDGSAAKRTKVGAQEDVKSNSVQARLEGFWADERVHDAAAFEDLKGLVVGLIHAGSESSSEATAELLDPGLQQDLLEYEEEGSSDMLGAGLTMERTRDLLDINYGPEQDEDEDVDGLSGVSSAVLTVGQAPDRYGTFVDITHKDYDDENHPDLLAIFQRIQDLLVKRSTNGAVYRSSHVVESSCNYKVGFTTFTKGGQWLGVFFDVVWT